MIKLWVHNWKFKKRKLSSCCGFCNELTNQFEVSPLGSVFWQITSKSKFWCDDLVIQQGTLILESPQVLLVSTFRSLDNLVVIKTQIVVPQKLDIPDFRKIKHNVVTANSSQFVGSINFEGNSSTTGHHVAYWNYSTGVIKLNDSSIQHYSDSILTPCLSTPVQSTPKIPRWKWGLQNQSPVKKVWIFYLPGVYW